MTPQDFIAKWRNGGDERRDFQSFFDDLDGRSLSDQQREACIRLEDNNLLVASAGSGKSATMVGKEPDELLQALLDKVDNLFDAVPKSKDKSDNEKIADFLREIGL